MEHTRTHHKSLSYHLYRCVLFLYPTSYIRMHRDEMLQNFEDLEKDTGSQGALMKFILRDLVISLPIQYVKLVKRSRSAQLVVLLILMLAALLAYQVYATNLAHTSFQRYATFRECVTISHQTPTSADCTTDSGKTFKIVEISTRWYRDGDGPGIW